MSAAPTVKKRKSSSSILSNRLFWTVLALVLLIVVDVVKDPAFLRIGITNGALNGPLVDVLHDSAPFIMIAIGMTLVVSTAGIDLSVGSLMAVSGAVAMQFMANTNGTGVGSAFLALILALAVTGIIGAWNGMLVAVGGLQPFITTLIMMLAGRGIAQVITNGENTAASNDVFSWIGSGYLLGIPFPWILATLLVVLVGVLMRKTALGMMIESVGINPEASRMAGINPKKILFIVYVISGVLAGMAGVFATSNVMRVTPTSTGYTYEMDAVLAVVIGGTSLLGGKFNMVGAYVGALIISLLEKTIVWLGVSNAATPAFKAVIVIVICVLQSSLVANALSKRKKKGKEPQAQGSQVASATEGSIA